MGVVGRSLLLRLRCLCCRLPVVEGVGPCRELIVRQPCQTRHSSRRDHVRPSLYVLHCKKYPYIRGYFVASFPYLNGTDSVYVSVRKLAEFPVMENSLQNIRRCTNIFYSVSSSHRSTQTHTHDCIGHSRVNLGWKFTPKAGGLEWR